MAIGYKMISWEEIEKRLPVDWNEVKGHGNRTEIFAFLKKYAGKGLRIEFCYEYEGHNNAFPGRFDQAFLDLNFPQDGGMGVFLSKVDERNSGVDPENLQKKWETDGVKIRKGKRNIDVKQQAERGVELEENQDDLFVGFEVLEDQDTLTQRPGHEEADLKREAEAFEPDTTRLPSERRVAINQIFTKKTGKKLAELAEMSPISSLGQSIDKKEFTEITDRWHDEINKKNNARNEYENVKCEKTKEGEMVTTIQIDEKKQEIKHRYDDVIKCPVVTVTNPPHDQTIYLFMESSKMMAPLTLESSYGTKTALRLFEAGLIAGTEIILKQGDIESIQADKDLKERYGDLLLIKDNVALLNQFRDILKNTKNYKLCDTKLPITKEALENAKKIKVIGRPEL